MMLPLPTPVKGILKHIDGLAQAQKVPGITAVKIAAKRNQVLIPLPEGSSDLGYLFARGATSDEVEEALRQAHKLLRFDVDPEPPPIW